MVSKQWDKNNSWLASTLFLENGDDFLLLRLHTAYRLLHSFSDKASLDASLWHAKRKTTSTFACPLNPSRIYSCTTWQWISSSAPRADGHRKVPPSYSPINENGRKKNLEVSFPHATLPTCQGNRNGRQSWTAVPSEDRSELPELTLWISHGSSLGLASRRIRLRIQLVRAASLFDEIKRRSREEIHFLPGSVRTSGHRTETQNARNLIAGRAGAYSSSRLPVGIGGDWEGQAVALDPSIILVGVF